MAELLRISTTARKQVVDSTDQVEAVIRKAKMQEGLCSLFITHTTAALTTGEVGEGTEQDFLQVVEQMIPRIHFRHAHDPSHAWSDIARRFWSRPLTNSGRSRQTGARYLAIRDAGRTGWPTRTNRARDSVSVLTSASSARGEVFDSVVPR